MMGRKTKTSTGKDAAKTLSSLVVLTFAFHLVLSVLDKVGKRGQVLSNRDVATRPVAPVVSQPTLKKRDFSTALCLALLIALTGHRLWPLQPYFRATYLVQDQDWRQTQGVVHEATIVRSHYGSRGTRYWEVVPRYSYTVGERRFEGHLFQVLPKLSNDGACRIAANLKAMPQRIVYYDKSHPEFSTLLIPTKQDVMEHVYPLLFVYGLIGGIWAISSWVRFLLRIK